jgi:hypothetical protein
MICVYQDWDLYRRFYVRGGESNLLGGAQGFLLKPRAGCRIVIDLVMCSISAPFAADLTTTYNIQLVTIDSAGAVSPASPNQVALYDIFKEAPVSAAQNSSRCFARGGLKIQVPEGKGVGWNMINAVINSETAGNITYVPITSFDIGIAGYLLPVPSRETAPDDSFLQPAGSGL